MWTRSRKQEIERKQATKKTTYKTKKKEKNIENNETQGKEKEDTVE